MLLRYLLILVLTDIVVTVAVRTITPARLGAISNLNVGVDPLHPKFGVSRLVL